MGSPGFAPACLARTTASCRPPASILGVAAAHARHPNILLTGIAGLVAGAMSMAVGEYVSVHSQADSEAAAVAQERAELETDPPASVTSSPRSTSARTIERISPAKSRSN